MIAGLCALGWARLVRSGDLTRDDLLLRLYDLVRTVPDSDFGLLMSLDGYVADGVVENNAGSAGVLLDRRAGLGAPSRHLRLGIARARLLGDPGEGCAGVRLPTWRLFDDRPADEHLFVRPVTPPGLG